MVLHFNTICFISYENNPMDLPLQVDTYEQSFRLPHLEPLRLHLPFSNTQHLFPIKLTITSQIVKWRNTKHVARGPALSPHCLPVALETDGGGKMWLIFLNVCGSPLVRSETSSHLLEFAYWRWPSLNAWEPTRWAQIRNQIPLITYKMPNRSECNAYFTKPYPSF